VGRRPTLTAADLERITTTLEVLELVLDDGTGAVDGPAATTATAAPPARRKSLAARSDDWASLIAPLFGLLAAVQARANAGARGPWVHRAVLGVEK
jgi:hypothetical protein